jgi:uncharacterized protein YndB with AHSA1/START domain
MTNMSDGNGTLGQDTGRYFLHFERLLSHSPERVWQAITEEDELSAWFPARMVGPRERGAVLQFIFAPVPGQVPEDSTEEGIMMTGEMRVFDPPLTLEYTWDVDVLRFELEARPEGTLLKFTHTFDDKGRGAREAAGWDICLASLEAQVAGDSAEPFTNERHADLFERYALRFGPDGAVHKNPNA